MNRFVTTLVVNNMSVDEIIFKFDYLKVRKVMDALDWKWLGKYVTMSDMMDTSRMLLETVDQAEVSKDNQFVACSTGGFKAVKRYMENSNPKLELHFIVSSQEST